MAHDAPKIRLIMAMRQAGISDARVLAAIEQVPREQFVPKVFAHKAYEDIALPIGQGQTITRPLVVARMTQALAPAPDMRVLEVGTGSGYQAAVLARLCRRVVTIERHDGLRREAEARFMALRIRNVTAMTGDGALGWERQAPYGRIIVTAAAEDYPAPLMAQLDEDGIMVLPIQDQGVFRITRKNGDYETEELGADEFVPLLPGRGGEDAGL